MDENGVRALLDRVASAQAPASTIDLSRARRVGRHKRRLLRVLLPGSAAGAVLAIVSLVASGVLPFGSMPGHPSGQGGQGGHPRKPPPVHAPAVFNPLLPFGAFGWLPAGYSVTGGGASQVTSTITPAMEVVQAADGGTGNVILLGLNSAGSCHLTGPFTAPPYAIRYPHGLACKGDPPMGPAPGQAWPLSGAAPAIAGRRAFWGQGMLVWEYGPRAWAELQTLPPSPSASANVLLVKVASRLVYGRAPRLRFPFQLRHLPRTWQIADSTLGTRHGQQVGTGLDLGPGQDTYALSISTTPFGQNGMCDSWVNAQSQPIIVDGAKGTLRTQNLPGKFRQQLCFGNLHGFALGISSSLGFPFSSPIAEARERYGVLTILGHMRFFGPDPANWTQHPLG